MFQLKGCASDHMMHDVSIRDVMYIIIPRTGIYAIGDVSTDTMGTDSYPDVDPTLWVWFYVLNLVYIVCAG